MVAFAFVTNAIIKALQQMNTLNRNVYSTASSRSYVETITDNFLKRYLEFALTQMCLRLV